MTLQEVTATSADNTSSDCRHRPTAITVAVGDLKVKGKEVSPDSNAAQDLMRRTCQPKVAKWLGTDAGDLRLSRLTAVWFVPTPEQVEAGASWFRCDVIGFDRGDHLQPLPAPRGSRLAQGRPRRALRALRHRQAGCEEVPAGHVLAEALVDGDRGDRSWRRQEYPR